MTKTINHRLDFKHFPGMWIEVGGLPNGISTVCSNLKDLSPCATPADARERDCFNAGIDAIEAMVLGHFSADPNLVTSAAYLEGIEAAYSALGQEYD